jgi:hypothetical protein
MHLLFSRPEDFFAAFFKAALWQESDFLGVL